MTKFFVPTAAIFALLGLAACQPGPQGTASGPTPMFDNGQMRPPQPLATGDVSVTRTAPQQNGNMTPPSYGGGLPAARP